jgi:hypothetical protein
MVGLLTFALSMHSRTCKSGELKWQRSIYGDFFRWIFNSNEGRKSCNELWIASSIPLILLTNVLMDIVWLFLFIVDEPESLTLFPSTTTYTVVEGDNTPSISCTVLCRPECSVISNYCRRTRICRIVINLDIFFNSNKGSNSCYE